MNGYTIEYNVCKGDKGEGTVAEVKRKLYE